MSLDFPLGLLLHCVLEGTFIPGPSKPSTSCRDPRGYRASLSNFEAVIAKIKTDVFLNCMPRDTPT